MCELIVTEHGSVVGLENSRVYVRIKDEIRSSIPLNMLDNIVMMSNSTITSFLVKTCLSRKIPITYASSCGCYLGALRTDKEGNTELQRKQCSLYDSAFALEFSRKIVCSKIANQALILYRHRYDADFRSTIKRMLLLKKKLNYVESIDSIRGIEGIAANLYFQSMSNLTLDFEFTCRSKRPPLDEVNALLSYGYFVLFNLLQSLIITAGLNPYFGLYHRDAKGHAALVSDMMEEWRAIIVDSSVISLIRKRMISKTHFQKGKDKGIYLNKEGVSIVSNFIKQKLLKNKYNDDNSQISLLTMIEKQVRSLVSAIRKGNLCVLWSPKFR